MPRARVEEALETMPSDRVGRGRASPRRSSGRRLFLAILLAGGGLPPAVAAADDATPLVSPDRIEDAPSTRLDPYPTFDNFAWRAFIALNWPSLLDAADRGAPDRAKTLGDPGPRVWETFKSRYELFEIGPDGKPAAPSPWASYDGRNPMRISTSPASLWESSSIRSSRRTGPTRGTKSG